MKWVREKPRWKHSSAHLVLYSLIFRLIRSWLVTEAFWKESQINHHYIPDAWLKGNGNDWLTTDDGPNLKEISNLLKVVMQHCCLQTFYSVEVVGMIYSQHTSSSGLLLSWMTRIQVSMSSLPSAWNKYSQSEVVSLRTFLRLVSL